jgi:hypothetical protein
LDTLSIPATSAMPTSSMSTSVEVGTMP